MSSNADISELRRAFRTLSKELHPDTTSKPYEIASRKFQAVCEAYNLLIDPVLRAKYDSDLLKQSSNRKESTESEIFSSNSFGKNKDIAEIRRSFSGGELFSLSLLAIAFLICILLVISFTFLQGKEFFIIPNWMMTVNFYA